MSDRAKRKKTLRRYVSRPTEIEACQWTGDPKSFYEVSRLTGNDKAKIADDDTPTLDLMILAGKDGAQGWVPVPVGHWVVRNPGDDSDYWPVDPDYFDGKYKPANAITVTMTGGCPQCGGGGVPGQGPSGDPPGAAAAAMVQAQHARRLRSDG